MESSSAPDEDNTEVVDADDAQLTVNLLNEEVDVLIENNESVKVNIHAEDNTLAEENFIAEVVDNQAEDNAQSKDSMLSEGEEITEESVPPEVDAQADNDISTGENDVEKVYDDEITEESVPPEVDAQEENVVTAEDSIDEKSVPYENNDISTEDITTAKNDLKINDEILTEDSVPPKVESQAKDVTLAEDAETAEDGNKEASVSKTAAEQNNVSSENNVLNENLINQLDNDDDGVSYQIVVDENKPKIPIDHYYNSDDFQSSAFISEDSGLPSDLLSLYHSFGYDCLKRDNLHVLDAESICYIAGNLLVIFNIRNRDLKYLRSTSGGGIGAVCVHPKHKHFAVAEKGEAPNVMIYEYPSLRLYRILRGGTEKAYSNCQFSPDGKLLATVGLDPDYMLTVWDWLEEQTVLRSKAFSQDIYRVTWAQELEGNLTTSGVSHIRFWKMASTFTGLKLQGELGKFGKTEISDIEGYIELPDGKVLSGCEWGNMFLWDGGLIKVEISRKQKRNVHNGPIQQIVMDEGELWTVGIDGYIRTWDFETIDTAEPFDETAQFEIEPMNEIRVGTDVRLKRIVKSVEDETTIWFAQDANGGIWKLDLSFSHTSSEPEKLCSYHAGAIVACDSSPISYLCASIGEDSSVKIFDFASRKVLVESRFLGSGSCIIWAPITVDPKGKTIVAGFGDGVVRVLHFGENPESDPTRKAKQTAELKLVQAMKPHNNHVTCMAFDKLGETLVTGSDDATIFFFTASLSNYMPIGFVKVKGPVFKVEWLDDQAVAVYLKDGHIYKVESPNSDSVDHSKTFELTHITPQGHFHFHSIKSELRHNEEVERKRIETETRKAKEEKDRRIRLERGLETEEEQAKQREDQEKEEARSKAQEETWSPFLPESPSPISYALSNPLNPTRFWLSMGEFDTGYFYECEFSMEDNDKPPVRSIAIPDSNDVAISSIKFSHSGQRVFFGLHNGMVRVQNLGTAFDLASMGSHYSLNMHDNHYGKVTTVCTSFDDKFLLSSGADGNFFVLEVMTEELQKEHERDYKAQIPSARTATGRKPDDIDDPNAYSIEEHKQKSEHDRMVKLAEEKKIATRRRINDLRNAFRKIKDVNLGLPQRIQLHLSEFEMVPELRESLLHKRDEQIALVHKEMAWVSEKDQIALDKMKIRFRNQIECDRIVVKSIQSTHKVSTIRANKLMNDFYELKYEMEKKRTTTNLKDITRDPTLIASSDEEDNTSIQGAEVVKEEQVEDDGAASNLLKTTLKGARGERIQLQLRKVAEKKRKRALRRAEWSALFANKPDNDYEDPDDVKAITEAKENMGDFKLKTASDYVVPPHLRMNSDKSRQRLLDMEEKMYYYKKNFNEAVLRLRDKKLDVIEKMRKLCANMEVIHSRLPRDQLKPIPSIPQLDPEEIPEKKFEYTRELLSQFKIEQDERRAAELRGEEVSGFSSFKKLNVINSVAGAPVAGAPNQPRLSRLSERMKPGNFSADETIDEKPRSALQIEQEMIADMRDVFEQYRIIRTTERLVRNFDAELRLVRHQKFELDVKLKKAELRQLTLYEEFQLLKEFEKSEGSLANRVEQRQEERVDINMKVVDCTQKLETKKKDIERIQEREKQLEDQFRQSIGENNKFSDYLTKVFKKKIKRKKKEREGDESNEESDESSDDDSDLESEEEDSDEEAVHYDLDICPPGCDQTLYDNTCALREKRLDIEEEYTEEKKIQDALRKELDAFQRKLKFVESGLIQAENELEAFQLEKQQKLNELHVVVILKMHQMLYHENGQLPNDLSSTLVFERTTLQKLQRRIRELNEEKHLQRKKQKEAKKHHIQLMKDRKIYQAHIADMQEKCDIQMNAKFGKLEDIERLEQIVINPKIEELTEKMLQQQEKMIIEQEKWESSIRDAKDHLIEQTRENTKRMTQMLMLYKERVQLESALDSRQKKLGGEYQGARASDIEEIERLMQLVQIQAQELNALKEEIGMLSRKGGHILPPVQPPLPPDQRSALM